MHLGTRSQLLLWCAAVWVLVGIGVLAHQSNEDPAFFHTHLPTCVRVGGWWVTAALGAYGALTGRHLRTAAAAMMIMPLQRLTSALWAWLMALIPGAPPGASGAWYPAIFYLFMVAVVVIATHVREPARDRGGDPAWTGQ